MTPPIAVQLWTVRDLDDFPGVLREISEIGYLAVEPFGLHGLRPAEFRRQREELQAAQVSRLAEGLPLPQLWLPHVFTTEIGLREVDQLADALAAGLQSLPELESAS